MYAENLVHLVHNFSQVFKYYTGTTIAHNLLTFDSTPTAFQLVCKNGSILPLPFLFASLLLGEPILEWMRWELSANEQWMKTLFTTLHCYKHGVNYPITAYTMVGPSFFLHHPLKYFLWFPKMAFTPAISMYTGNLGNLRRLMLILIYKITLPPRHLHIADSISKQQQ